MPESKSDDAARSAELPNLDGRAHQLTVEALLRRETYPDVVQHVEAIETHMSWVFLTERHAYKLKKPIKLARFNHTTLPARRSACWDELELNRRLAPDVYLDVVPLVMSRDGLRLEASGEAVDWLVKMRRLPRDRMLDACIASGAVQAAEIDRLAEHLAAFYARAERAPMEPAVYRGRIEADIAEKRRSLAEPRYGLRLADVDALADGQLRWLQTHGSLLETRSARVVDAHGDLRPEHVCLETPPAVIDCLEFDRALRLLDPLSELSFLALECRRLGASWIGERAIARYQTLAGDEVAPALRAFYESYHALVRAAVAIWHLDDGELRNHQRFRERAATYLRMAGRLS